MKFRVKNIKTGNFVTAPISMESAVRLLENIYSNDENYKIVPFEIDMDKMSNELKPMEDIVKTAIECIKNNKMNLTELQESVTEKLIHRYNSGNFMISEKECYIIWAIIFKNKNKIEDPKLLSLAHQHFIY
ncbi:MAG: hypothetical protein IPM32_18200 [Ignavibacteriae bacterium]|nr:hypothetical protein [Ignavibacteriota bacterium]